MKTSSAKQKGKRLCSLLRAKLLEYAPDLDGQNIVVPTTSQPGADLYLSPKAKEIYNYAFECKNTETLQIWAALAQSRTHVKGDEVPIVCFSRNREGKAYVALELEHFLKLTR